MADNSIPAEALADGARDGGAVNIRLYISSQVHPSTPKVGVIYDIVNLSDGLSIQRPGSGVNSGYLTDSKKNGNAAARIASGLTNLGSQWIGKVKVTRVSNPHSFKATEYVHHAVGHCWYERVPKGKKEGEDKKEVEKEDNKQTGQEDNKETDQDTDQDTDNEL